MSFEQEKLNEIFCETLARASGEERERYLASACGEDQELRRQVDSLLLSHFQAGDFLKQTVVPRDSPPICEGPGSMIGRYKLLQQIGEGGFGVVFMAEQQEPIRRMVALKIIKPGMDSREVIARFEAERQAVSLMDHPNIARVLDGGTTANWRPYFVMDLVKGTPITDFCDQNQLSTEARLKLFLEVCAGVQHAHQKGIIHRDLKPTNVLVTIQEGKPVPKVIDFGVAKAIGQKLTDRTLFTRFEQLIGTPAYMSPEQAEWSGVGVDTRSDIYSLGVLLYELLTGTTPFDKQMLSRAALEEVRRVIRETEPPTPSTRLHGLGQKLSEVAQRRNTEPSMLARLVRGDLDWIVMKTLEKDRGRRYQTINELARDVDRHLEGEPVSACPPSRAYRTGKFIRKHRIAVASGAAIASALITGLVLALVGFAQARRSGQTAKEDADTAQAVVDFLERDLLSQADPHNNTNRDVRVRELLDRASEKIKDRFTNQPLVEAMIRRTLGRTYVGLSEPDNAEPHIRRALEILNSKFGPDHPGSLECRSLLAVLYCNREMRAEAEPMLRELVESYRRIEGPDKPDTLDALKELGLNYLYWGHAEQAEDILRGLVETRRRVQGPNHRDTLQAMVDLAGVYNFSDRSFEAAAMFEEVLNKASRIDHDELFIIDVKALLGETYLHMREYARAAELLNEVVEFKQRVMGPRHHETLYFLDPLVNADGCLGLWQQCVDLCREVATSSGDPSKVASFALCGFAGAFLADNTNACRDFTNLLLTQFANTTNAELARRVCEACLLVPESTPNLDPVFRLAALVPADSEFPPDKIVKGMAEYRRGNLPGALNLLEEPNRSGGLLACQAGYFCALIHYRQGDEMGAKNEMERATERLGSLLRSGELGEAWHEYGRVIAARKEAERVVLGQEVSPVIDMNGLETLWKLWEPVRNHLRSGDHLAAQRKWAEARDHYLAAIGEPAFGWAAAESSDSSLPSKIGITLLAAGDRVNYKRVCKALFDELERYGDIQHACPVLEAYLAQDSDIASDFGQKALKWSRAIEYRSGVAAETVDLIQAMAAYRSARYEETIKKANAAQKSKWLGTRCAGQIFRAMALGRAGRLLESKQELAQAEAQLRLHLSTLTGDSWWDLELCQLALNEAHQLVDQR